MPYMDRHDVWTIDADIARYLGVATLLVGSILRVRPMFVLGQRFSALPSPRAASDRRRTIIFPGPAAARSGGALWVSGAPAWRLTAVERSVDCGARALPPWGRHARSAA